MTRSFIVYNSCVTPDGTKLVCRHVHDYQSHTDTVTGEYYMLDGFGWYTRNSVNIVPAVFTQITSRDNHELIREHMEWTSYGINGGEVAKVNKLKDLSDTHIANILLTQTHLDEEIKHCFKQEQVYREVLKQQKES